MPYLKTRAVFYRYKGFIVKESNFFIGELFLI